MQVTTEVELRRAVEGWIADDPDEGDRAELQALLDRAHTSAGAAGDSQAQALAELRDRFAGRLEFGTAGLRGVVAAGPNRMNRAVVRAATAAVAGWLLDSAAADGGNGPGDAGRAAGSGPRGASSRSRLEGFSESSGSRRHCQERCDWWASETPACDSWCSPDSRRPRSRTSVN